ncbi:MAG TPA: GNAT family N-acetyltransferase [Bdellovibrionota bacterium]
MVETRNLRPALLSDISALEALINGAYRGDSSRRGWTTEADLLGGQRIDEEMLREKISSAQSVLLVATPEDPSETILGCVYLERQGTDKCYLGLLTVNVDLQGKGIGDFLLRSGENWARAHFQSKRMCMTVFTVRPELLAWYERRGYRDCGERIPFTYGDPKVGLPLRQDLEFAVLVKDLSPS